MKRHTSLFNNIQGLTCSWRKIKDNKTATEAEHVKLASERSESIHPDTLHISLGMKFRQLSLRAKDSSSSALSEAYQKTQQQCRKALSLRKNELPIDILPTHGCLHSLSLIKCTFYSEEKQRNFCWYWNLGLDLGANEGNVLLTHQVQTVGAGDMPKGLRTMSVVKGLGLCHVPAIVTTQRLLPTTWHHPKDRVTHTIQPLGTTHKDLLLWQQWHSQPARTRDLLG